MSVIQTCTHVQPFSQCRALIVMSSFPGGVDSETPDAIRMGLEGGYFPAGVVVEDTKLEIVQAINESYGG